MAGWEYRLVDSSDADDGNFLEGASRQKIEEYLNGLGADGWEIVNLDFVETESRSSFIGVAKRPTD